MAPAFAPENAQFVILSFEGPDRYAQAGGLGVRVKHLGRSLALRGYQTHLFFIGDPHLPSDEALEDGRFHLHRWGQWISRHHPQGVYDGEHSKINDYIQTLPEHIVNTLARPAAEQGQKLVVLAEEWHTAAALCRLSDALHAAGLRQQAVLFWNANNTMGFHQIDWPRLNFVATITTVSRYMKQIMRGHGVDDALVIPNGIPAELLEPVNAADAAAVRQATSGADGWLLFKVGRYDPAKCWINAIDAAALLKSMGKRVCFPCRGGIEPHGYEVLERARSRGLVVSDVDGSPASWQEVIELIHSAPPADVYNLRFFMTQSMLRPFYAAADVVLANSKHEPFGLVGLEAMAAGGLVFTGPTGETYSIDGQGALALDTENAEEIVLNLLKLREHPEYQSAMRQAALRTAGRFTWDRVLDVLLHKVELAAFTQGVTLLDAPNARPLEAVQDVVIYTVVHQPRRLRLPARPIPPGASPEEMAECLFDQELDQHYFRRVAERCYYPATERFLSLVNQGLKLTIGFSLSFLIQVERWDPQLLELFQRLVRHPNVELAAVEPYHCFILLWDMKLFAERMRYAVQRLEQIFGVRCRVTDTTELMMSDTIYHTLEELDFSAAFCDGRPWVMEWRQPTFLYQHNHSPLRLLTRHYPLSDDVGFRFSDRNWDGWPLTASTYSRWLAQATGDLVVLGWDYETFGEHHSAESGIFDFLDWLAPGVQQAGLSFLTASQAVSKHAAHTCDLPLPAFPSTWAGSGGMDFFLGNPVQQAVFQLMLFAYDKARLTGEPALLDLALWLAQSDHLHLIQWYGRQDSEANVSAHFTPAEWWPLGAERIVAEIQQVYKNFIAALDAYLPGVKTPRSTKA